MNKTFDQMQLTQILYEISMSIGASVELRDMLKTSLSTILKKLNCVSGGVYQTVPLGDGTNQLQAVYTIPRRPERNTTYQEASTRIPQIISDAAFADLLQTLPLLGQGQEDAWYHILELPHFGLLLLIKNREALDESTLKSLTPLLKKLASAATACTNEAKLRQSEERYRMLNEATFDGIVIHDGPIILEINAALAEILAANPEELTGKNIYDFLDPSCHELAGIMAQQLSKTPYELTAVRTDGVRLPIEVTDRDYTENGQTYRVTAVRNLSQQKQLETELESLVERRTRQVRISTQVAQAIAEATNLNDLYHRIVTEIKEQFGYYHTQLLRYDPEMDAIKLITGYGDIGRKMQVAGHQMPLGQGLIGAAAATGQSVLRPDLTEDPDWQPNPHLPHTKGEIAVPIKLGEEILGVLDVQSDTPGALNNNDQLLLEGLCGQIAVAIDTTRLTTDLQETSSFLNSVIDNIPNMVFVKDAQDLRFIRLNKIGQTYFGKSLEEVVGKNDFDFFPEEEAAFFTAKDQEVVHSGKMLDIPEESIETPFGLRILHTTKVPIMGSDGSPKYLMGISDDITDRKQTEEKLRQSEQILQEVYDQQKNLHDVGLELANIENADELYKQVILLAREKLGFDRLGLYLLNADTGTMTGTYGVGPDGNLRSEQSDSFSFTNEPWIHEFIYNKERLVLIEDGDLYEQQKVIGHGWHMIAAVWQKDKPIGVIFADNLLFQEPLRPAEPDTLTAYAATIANLITRMQSQQALRESEQTLQAFLEKQQSLQEIGILLSGIENPADLYEKAIELGSEKLGFERLGLYLLDPTQKFMHGTFGIGADGILRNEYNEVFVLADEPWMYQFMYGQDRLIVNEDVDLFENGKVAGHGWSITTALWVRNKPIGVMFSDNLLSQTPLSPYQPELLAAYGATIANLIDRAQAEDERERLLTDTEEQAKGMAQLATDLQTVADLSAQITSISDPQKMMEVIVQETQERFKLYHCHIFLIDEAGKNLGIKACGWHSDALQHGTHGDTIVPLNSKKSLVAQAARTRQAVIINDVLNDPNWLPNVLLPDTRSEMALPMIVGDTLLGVFDVQSTEIDRFDSSDIKIQATLAAQVAVALENANSLERSKQAVAELDALTRRLTRESWEAYVSELEKDETELVYSFGELAPVDLGVKNDAAGKTAVSPANGQHSQSLIVHGEAIGHLTIFSEAETEQIDTDTALIVAAIAEQLSSRVENIRLSEQTQQALAQTQNQAQRLGMLNEISAEMSNAETLNKVFDIIFARIPDLLKADRVSLAMLQPDKKTLNIIGYEGSKMDMPTGTIIPLENSAMSEALEKRKIIVDHKTSLERGIKSSMVAPIFSAGNPVGTLNIVSNKSNALTEQDETLLQQLATMLSSVIENKQLLDAAQARAERERQVRTITDRIRRGVDREAILNIAQKEISQLIGASQSAAQLGTKTQLLERIQHSIEQTKQVSD